MTEQICRYNKPPHKSGLTRYLKRQLSRWRRRQEKMNLELPPTKRHHGLRGWTD